MKLNKTNPHRAAPWLSLLGVAVALTQVHLPAHADWPRWRGPHDNGDAARPTTAVPCTPDNLRWQVALPGKGCSTPVVWEQRIYLTAPTNGLDAVLAWDAAGRALWQTTFGPEDPGKHRNGSGSNASPVTDGESLAVCFKSGTLAVLELDGRLRWQTDLVERFGPVELFWDYGTSPVLTRRSVVMARIHGGDSWVAAFDKTTGELQWKIPRNYQTPVEGDNAYTTPIVLPDDDQETLLVWGAEHLTAYAASDGRLLWTCGGFNPDERGYWPAVASPVVIGDIAVVPTGRNDRNQPRLHGIRLGGKGDVTETHRLWVSEDTGTFVPTPAAFRDQVLVLRDRGQVDCLDPKTGAFLWRDEFPRHRANYYASPLVAADHLYAAREDGLVFVARIADGRLAMVSEHDLGESVIASPVPLASSILIRGEHHLFCFGKP